MLYDAQPPGARTITVVTGQTATDINFGNIPTGSIEGRKFHDVNADGQHNGSEPWLNGWTVELQDDLGNVIATTVTADIDRNGDGLIDPGTERGIYQFKNLVPGIYGVSEETRPLWTQSGASGLFAREAYELNQLRFFREPQNDFLNWGGRNEKWLWSNASWHFVTPDGSIYQWNNSPRTALTGALIASYNSDYWEDLSLIYDPPRPNNFIVTIRGHERTGVDFSNTFAHDGTGSGNVVFQKNSQDSTLTGDDLSNTVVVYTGS